MRFDLASQIGVVLPEVRDQRSLLSIGKKLGVFDDTPLVSDALSGGSTRLAILTREVADEILEQPCGDDHAGQDESEEAE